MLPHEIAQHCFTYTLCHSMYKASPGCKWSGRCILRYKQRATVLLDVQAVFHHVDGAYCVSMPDGM